MNDSSWKVSRVRKRSLLIVEGNHEKNELFRLLFKCFPEIKVDMDDVWIYGTNIYMLHEEVKDEVLRRDCVEGLLAISESSDLDKRIELKLLGVVAPDKLNTAKFQLVDTIGQRGYLTEGKSYWNYMRSLFRQIIIHNICKANKIQNEEYQIGPELYKECFEQLDLEEILRKQNEVSRNSQKGYIWVLNTCVFLIADYNFSLVA